MAARRTAAAVHVTQAPVTDAPRLDVWLAHERTITRHAAHTLIAAGLVSVNGRRGRPGQRVHQRDAVEVVDVPEAAAGTGVEGASRRRAGPSSEQRASRELSGGTPAGFRPRTPQHQSHRTRRLARLLAQLRRRLPVRQQQRILEARPAVPSAQHQHDHHVGDAPLERDLHGVDAVGSRHDEAVRVGLVAEHAGGRRHLAVRGIARVDVSGE
ncbi:MAG: hypothetical protein E6I55_08495 [Chloroflexi bacterium]|nr:MAG: hypothetical protein E6I55_08495 [Chloroflexota bacterium]